ncbi:MAG: DNA-binding response regulator, partial [Acidobacteriota bacterium]
MDNPALRARATGWLARARRLIEDAKQPCVEEGWVLCSTGYLHVVERDVDSARAAFARAAEIGERFQNRDLQALARHGHGRCLLALGSISDGLALLDEVMIGITNGEVGPIISGVVYCSVISACYDLFDLGRAQEWTMALQAWCTSHPDLVPFRGYCLIRRSELLQLHGEWQDAINDARRACERAGTGARQPEAGGAYYQLGELHRLRGELSEAEEAYRLANPAGRKPYPGLALLRL